MRQSVFILVLCILLSGCGQTGSLYLPNHKISLTQQAAQTNLTNQANN